jgi:hypothetical protein
VIHLAAVAVAAVGVGVFDAYGRAYDHIVVDDVILSACDRAVDDDVTGSKAVDELVNAGCIMRA